MEYVQERVTTLHDLSGSVPDVSTDRACVVVPMTEREHATLSAERTLAALESVAPGRVVVALRAGPDRVGAFRDWIDGFDLPVDLLWCGGERVESLLREHGLDGATGKGRDVWLALGVAAATHPYVVCHDADRETYSSADVPRLLFPLEHGYAFSKGYYARVEAGRLYGRLFRLLYVPLVRALADRSDAPILSYLGAFRYALAGEFAATADLARRLGSERRFGLEVATLGGAFDYAGFDGSAQVDLGRYEHDHRAVGGPTGLADMSRDVASALLRVVTERGVDPAYDDLEEAYRAQADRLVRQYETDAVFNGFEYDTASELDQIEAYAAAIEPATADDRLPPWEEVTIDPADVLAASRADVEDAEGHA